MLSRTSISLMLLVVAGCAAPVGSEQAAELDGAEREHGGRRALGAVLSVERMEVTASIAAVGHAFRIRYRSTNPSGAPIVVSGAVIRPKLSVRLQHRDGADKIVAWAHGTAGLADICAPSEQSNFDVVQAGVDGIYAHLIASYVARGWTVAASDFPGLGTDGPSPYLVGDSEGRAIIDAVRAARHLDPFLSRDWVVVGHSQGGQAALFASELAPSYGRGLDLRGTVAMAPASSLEALLPAMVGTPLNALVVWTVYGLAALDPSVVPEDILAPPALAQIDALTNGCANEGLVAFGALSAPDLLVGGALPADFGAKLAANDPGQRPNGSPTLLVQGEQDPIIPPPITESLLAEECGINSHPLQLDLYPGVDHAGVVPAASEVVIAYIADCFAGAPAPSSCP